MKGLSFTFFLFLIFFTLNAQNIINIDLTRAKFVEIPAERVFEDIKYVRLETHTDGLLNIKFVSFYLTEKYIIAVNDLQRAYLFNRETGTFIRRVGSIGQGPNEYSGIICNGGFDETNNILFINETWSLWKSINIETNRIESILYKPLPENDIDTYINSPWFIKDNLYVSFCNNVTGKNKVRLIVYNKEGTIIKKYPNFLEYEKVIRLSYNVDNGRFYYYNGLTFFKEGAYNDTVFCVDENRMSPHIVFKLGNKQPSYFHQDIVGYNTGKYMIHFIYESDSFIIFNISYSKDTENIKVPDEIKNYVSNKMVKNIYSHVCYYDKKTKQTFISSTSDLKKTGYTTTDIPVCIYPNSINKRNEMIAKIDPEELIKYKDRIDSKYKSLFQNIQEDDNPIVVIAKLK